MTSLSKAATAKLAQELEANKPAPDWASVPELKKWKQKVTVKGKEVSMTFDEMVTAYKDIDAEIKFRDKSKVELKAAIEAAVMVSGEDRVECEGYHVIKIEKAGARKIDSQKLLELGVDAMTIVKATVVGKGSVYVDIRLAAKDKDDK